MSTKLFRALGFLNILCCSSLAVAQSKFIRGDCNGDATFTGISDAIFLFNFNFLGGSRPQCIDACDANDDGSIGSVTDGIYILQFSFVGGPQPPLPFPTCGSDATADTLDCEDAAIDCVGPDPDPLYPACLDVFPDYTVPEERIPTPEPPRCEDQQSCTITTIRLGHNWDEFILYGPRVWPGAFLDSHECVFGNPNSLVLCRERYPIEISINDLGIPDDPEDPTDGATRLVRDPKASTIEGAINDILRDNEAVARTTARLSFYHAEFHTVKQLAIDLELDLIFKNIAAAAGFNFVVAEDERSTFTKVLQMYYTVTISDAVSGEDYLCPESTCEDVDLRRAEEIPPVPVIVSSVGYGRLLVYQTTTKKTVTTANASAAFEAVVFGGGGNAEQQQIMESSEKRLLVLGGDAFDAVRIITTGQAKEYLENGARWRLDSPGWPLSYRMNYLGRHLPPFRAGAATEFQIKECQVGGGDNLWRYRVFGCDVGHEVFQIERDGRPACGNGNCPGPNCWGEYATAGGDSGPGSLRVSRGQDHQLYGEAFFYSKDTITSINLNVGGNGAMKFWVNDQVADPASITLRQSCNHVEWTLMHQHDEARLTLDFKIRDYPSILRMDSTTCDTCP